MQWRRDDVLQITAELSSFQSDLFMIDCLYVDIGGEVGTLICYLEGQNEEP